MKLHRNLVNEAALTLQRIFSDNLLADRAIESVLRSHPQWGSRDRRFVAEAVYDIVRNFRLYSTVAGNKKNFWFITAVWLVDKSIAIPDWPEFRNVDTGAIGRALERLRRDPVLRYSFPDWLWQLCLGELGDEKWRTEAAALHEQAEVFVRVNALKTTTAQLSQRFNTEKNQLIPAPPLPETLRLARRENIFRHALFAEGLFEVQDAGSQQIAPFLHAEPGETVIDACAGAGGKTLHLAALMKNKGRVIAMDVNARKLDELKRRARRAGVNTVESRLINDKIDIKALYGKADRLLLDVPCSGLGVLRRNPDAKWKLSEPVIAKTKEIQASILEDYHEMLKPGGTLVYSTCSILPSENEQQVQQFLSNHKMYLLEGEVHLWPSGGTDGFYMARLRRKV